MLRGRNVSEPVVHVDGVGVERTSAPLPFAEHASDDVVFRIGAYGFGETPLPDDLPLLLTAVDGLLCLVVDAVEKGIVAFLPVVELVLGAVRLAARRERKQQRDETERSTSHPASGIDNERSFPHILVFTTVLQALSVIAASSAAKRCSPCPR